MKLRALGMSAKQEGFIPSHKNEWFASNTCLRDVENMLLNTDVLYFKTFFLISLGVKNVILAQEW